MATRLELPAVQQALDELVTQQTLPGWSAAVRRGGEIWTGCGGRRNLVTHEPVTSDTAFRIASLTKPVAAILALQAIERDEIGVESPITEWVPELGDLQVWVGGAEPLTSTVPAQRAVTVRHLLTMTSGWGMAMSGGALDEALFASPISPGPSAPPVDEAGYLAALRDLPLAFQPGEGWLYHNSSDVLGIVLARAAGTDVATLLRERVAGPLGLDSLTFWADPARPLATSYVPGEGGFVELDPEGFGERPSFFSLAAGLGSTAADYLPVLAELWQPRTVSDELAVLARTGQLDARQLASASTTLEPGATYGFQVSVVDDPTPRRGSAGAFGWTGGTGCVAICDPESETVAVLLTNGGLHARGEPAAFAAFFDGLFAE